MSVLLNPLWPRTQNPRGHCRGMNSCAQGDLNGTQAGNPPLLTLYRARQRYRSKQARGVKSSVRASWRMIREAGGGVAIEEVQVRGAQPQVSTQSSRRRLARPALHSSCSSGAGSAAGQSAEYHPGSAHGCSARHAVMLLK